MTRKPGETDLQYIARAPQFFDAQRYLEANPDVIDDFDPEGKSEQAKRWALTWGSMKDPDGQEVGGALTHFIRYGHGEGREAFFRDKPDASFDDIYGKEYLSGIPGDGFGGDAVTAARFFDMGILGHNEDKTNLTGTFKPTEFGETVIGDYHTAAGFYPASEISPTRKTFQALSRIGDRLGFRSTPEGAADFDQFISNGLESLTDEDDVAARSQAVFNAAQREADGTADRESQEAVQLSLLGAKDVKFTGPDGRTFQLPKSVAEFIERQGLPPIGDPYEGIDPETGLSFDQLQHLHGVNASTTAGQVSTANVANAVQNGASVPNFVPDPGDPLGLTTNIEGTLGNAASAALTVAGAPTGIGTLASLAGQGMSAAKNVELVAKVLNDAGLDSGTLSGWNDFMSQGLTGMAGFGTPAGVQGGKLIIDAMNAGNIPNTTDQGLLAAFAQLPDTHQVGALESLGVGVPIPAPLFDPALPIMNDIPVHGAEINAGVFIPQTPAPAPAQIGK